MCTAFIAWKCQPSASLVVLSNRDEFHSRPTAVANWDASNQVLGGVDLQAGGRWLGVNKSGYFAVLLNVRDLPAFDPQAASRGAIIDNFLASQSSAIDFAAEMSECTIKYNPYNLLLCDGNELVYFCNQPGCKPQVLAPGLYGVSNGGLDEGWPKVAKGKGAVRSLLANWSIDKAFSLLANRQQANDDMLPETGVPLDLERLLSSLFIVSDNYGTRASTIVTLSPEVTDFYERSFDATGQITNEKHYQF